MKSMAEHNLGTKIKALEFRLRTADECVMDYKKICQDQQKRIDMLLTRMNEIILLTQEAIDNHY